jgi:hypothetical protein
MGMKMVELSAEEVVFFQRYVKEHVEYYRVLAGNEKFSNTNRAKKDFVENLLRKLVE